MHRRTFLLLGALAAAALLAGGGTAAQAALAGKSLAQALPPALQGLAGIPAQERFQHFLGRQTTYTDRAGNRIVIEQVPGTVTAVEADKITIKPNDGGDERTFNVTRDTRVRGRPAQGALTVFANGDRVIVTVVAGSADALSIVKAEQVTQPAPRGRFRDGRGPGRFQHGRWWGTAHGVWPGGLRVAALSAS